LLVQERNRAAAGANLDNVEDGRSNRNAAAIPSGVIDRLDAEASVAHDRALCCCASHVERDQAIEAEMLAVGAGADAAADRTGFDQKHRRGGSMLHRQYAPI
jgi:hypothetical protein